MKVVFNNLLIALIFFVSILSLGAQNLMNHDELIKLLPRSVRGFSADSDPIGNTINMREQMFSTVEQNFIRDDYYLKITLFDYSTAPTMFEQSSAIWEQGDVYENDEGFARSLTFDNKSIEGWEIYDSESETAEIFIGVSRRFFIIINAEGQNNTEFIRSVADPLIARLSLM